MLRVLIIAAWLIALSTASYAAFAIFQAAATIHQAVGLQVVTSAQTGQSSGLSVVTSAQTGQSSGLNVVTSQQ
jgi:hypothetical protein